MVDLFRFADDMVADILARRRFQQYSSIQISQ